MRRAPQFGLGRLVVLVAQLLWRLAARLVWVVRQVWWRLGNRARLAASLVVLVILAAHTATLAPAFSAVAESLAVLLVAAVGLSMILTSPFRQ